jgi:hypothetical protein
VGHIESSLGFFFSRKFFFNVFSHFLFFEIPNPQKSAETVFCIIHNSAYLIFFSLMYNITTTLKKIVLIICTTGLPSISSQDGRVKIDVALHGALDR